MCSIDMHRIVRHGRHLPYYSQTACSGHGQRMYEQLVQRTAHSKHAAQASANDTTYRPTHTVVAYTYPTKHSQRRASADANRESDVGARRRSANHSRARTRAADHLAATHAAAPFARQHAHAVRETPAACAVAA